MFPRPAGRRVVDQQRLWVQPYRQGTAPSGHLPRPVRSSRQVRPPRSRSGRELRSSEGGARPLGGLEHRAGAASGQPEPNRSGARHGAGYPATVLPLTPQYRQYRRTSHRPSRPTSTSERPPSNGEPGAPPGSNPATPSLPSMRRGSQRRPAPHVAARSRRWKALSRMVS